MGENALRVTVVGAGLMGAGIGLGFAQHGAEVTYLVRDVPRAVAAVRGMAVELVEIGMTSRRADEGVAFCDALEGLPESDLVVESVPENLTRKQEIFRKLSCTQPDALLCSNTSSLSITDVFAGVRGPERVAGMHFWYPPPLMPLVELVPGRETSAETLDRAEAALRAHGKVPIRLAFDVPGFVWNRLVVAVLREAVALVRAGVVGPGELDLVVEQGLARRWSLTGPLSSAVLGGLTTFETVGRNLLPLLDQAQDLEGLSSLLENYVEDPRELARWRNERLAAQRQSL